MSTPRRLPRSRAAALFAVVALALSLAAPAGARRRAPARTTQPTGVELSAEVNATKVRVGDVFQLDVVLTVRSDAQPDELVLPDLSDFKVVRSQRGPSSSSTTIVNGRMSVKQSAVYTYLLRADAPGKKRIGPARARVGRSVATSDPIVVEVVEKAGADKADRSSDLDPAARFPEGEDLPPFFLDVRFDKDEVYTGEQALLSVQVYARDLVDIDVRDLETPKPPGFWVEVLESPSRVRPTQRTLRGQTYLVYPLLKVALFPLEAGEHTLDPIAVTIAVSRGGVWGRRQQYTLSSDPVALLALPLPKEGRPQGFVEGNVGRFQLSATVDKREVPLGQPVTLRVQASGEGNLGAVSLPDVASELEGARVFPPTFDERKAVHHGRLYGEKLAELLVQPKEAGTFEIPAFTLRYFDPGTKRYEVARTEPITLRVTPSAVSSGQKGARQAIFKGARPVHRRLVAPQDPRPLHARPLYLGGLLASLVVGGALFAAGRRRQASSRSLDGRRRKARRARRAAFERAREERDLTATEHVLVEAVAARFGDDVRALASDRLGPELEARGLQSSLARDLGAFFEAALTARYAPKSGVDRKSLFDDAERLLERIEEGA